MRRIIRAILALVLLPMLVSAGQLPQTAEIGRTRTQSIEDVKALNQLGTNQHSEDTGFDNIKSSPSYEGGTSADYLTARIARDHPDILECHYEQEINGTYTRHDGSTFEAPIGRIVVSECSSPEDLARRVEELTQQVRAQATAQAAQQ